MLKIRITMAFKKQNLLQMPSMHFLVFNITDCKKIVLSQYYHL